MRFLQQFHPLVWIILGGTVFTRIASFMAMPFLALYLHKDLGAGPLLIGITIGIAPLLSTIGGFIGGYLTDRFGRKRILLITVFVWSTVFIGFATTNIVAMFIVLNAINGLCRSFFEPATQALMIDFTPQEKRKRLFSLRYTAINIAAVIGPVVGVYIASLSSPSVPFLFTGAMYCVYGIFLMIVLNRYEMKQQKLATQIQIHHMFRIILSNRKMQLFVAGAILINFGYSQFDSTLPQLVELTVEDGVKLYSLLIALNAAVVLILQLPISIYSERYSTKFTLLLGIGFFVAGLALFGVANSSLIFVIGMVLFTIGEIFVFPTMNVLIDEIAPETQKASFLGAAQFKNLGSFIGPVIGGWLLVHFQDQLFLLVALIVLSSAAFYKTAMNMKQ
ncbi:MDR family MFS transporter [Viridibacillus sp. FSL H8-0110]|uniref:MDR family MFS transporter n=1 Tax=Viridibacillus sp. FSL H8-0110 TaxID=2921376 RepID=UPI0030F6D1BA